MPYASLPRSVLEYGMHLVSLGEQAGDTSNKGAGVIDASELYDTEETAKRRREVRRSRVFRVLCLVSPFHGNPTGM